jgi:hypothetical protein
MRVPQDWQEDTWNLGQDVVQRFRKKGSKEIVVEIAHVAFEKLDEKQLKELVKGIVKGNPVFDRNIEEEKLGVKGGTGVAAVFTGQKDGVKLKTRAHFISYPKHLFVLIGSVPLDATDSDWGIIAGMLGSFGLEEK